MITTKLVRANLKIALLLIALTILVFARAGRLELLSYDDNMYITDNHTVQQGLSWSNAAWAFTSLHAANWHPLTWLSLMLDIQLFGVRPGALHLVNVLFHAFNVVLLFLLLERMTGARWRSALVAALFAIHPLHVESVAWVAERKDVLSVFFGLAAMLLYARYADRPGVRRYLWVVLFFILSLLSKPMLVTLPFLLLLLDFWPLGRISGRLQPEPGEVPSGKQTAYAVLIAEKAPLLLLSIASSLVTIVAQNRGGAVSDVASLGLSTRLANAVVEYMRYLGKTFWPGSLAVFYPHPGSSLPAWQVVAASLLLSLITALALLRFKRSPWLAVGWFWFLGTLVPVIGLMQVGAQSIADRYTYFPLIGIFLMAVWEANSRLKGLRINMRWLWAGSLVIIVLLSAITWRQLGFWKNDETLFRHAMNVTKDNCVAQAGLAEALLRKGDLEEAYGLYKNELRLCPRDGQSWYNLGVLQRQRGENLQAEEALREALQLKPDYTMAWSNLGAVYFATGRFTEAIDALKEAARLAPRDASIRFNLGSVYGKAGRTEEAIAAYREAVAIDPDYAAAWNNLGVAYKNSGRIPEAGAAFRQVALIRKDDPITWYNLGIFYEKSRDPAQAIDAFREAARLDPGHAASWYHLGAVYASLGKRQEALEALLTLQSLDTRMANDLRRRIRPGQ
jgi:tetratricopeptide (TPR) repeat protein